jgi:hypothetical protein
VRTSRISSSVDAGEPEDSRPPASYLTAATTNDTLLPFDLPSVCRKRITVDFNGGTQSANGGLLLLWEKERTLGVCWQLGNTMTDRRDPNRIRHEMFEMVMAREYLRLLPRLTANP